MMVSKFNFENFSVVVPVYNEEEIVLESAAAIYAMAQRTGLSFEIIFSENGSTDNTYKILKSFSEEHNEVKVISESIPNYGMALKRGFGSAKNEVVVSFDIDYYSESFLNQCLELENEYAAITASKRLATSDDGRRFIRKLATNFFVIILKVLFRTNLSDTHGMKAVKKIYLNDHIHSVISTQDIFDTELLLRIEKNNGKIKEVPAKINELRPSVSVIYKRVPRTIKSLIKLKIRFYKESLKTKNL